MFASRFVRPLACVGLLCSVSFGAVQAQSYPNKPVRFIVPFSAGGGNDFLARDISAFMNERVKQPFVVENKAGGGGIIGSDLVAKAAPDGYSLLMGANTATIVDATRETSPFSLTKDLTGLGIVADMPIILVVNPSLGVRNVQELIALSKSRPGSLNYASSGPGTVQHMAGALFDSSAGTQMVHIPFKGAAQMIPELLASRVQVIFSAANTALPHIKSGALRALAVTGDKRWSEMPDLPTVAEQGVAGYRVDLWYAVFAPKNTPRPIVDFLNKELHAYVDDPKTHERFKGQALSPVKTTPDEMDQRVAADVSQWKDVAAKIQFKLAQ